MKILRLILVGLILFGIDNAYSQTVNCVGNYEIEFTKVPEAGGGPAITKLIAGKLEGTNFSGLRIVLYAKAGGKWWVQPTTENPFTSIGKDGKWQNETHLGIQYAAIIVSKTYKPSSKLQTLPAIESDVHGICITDATK